MGAALFTTSATTYVSDIAPLAKRGRYISYYQCSFFIGTSIGPATGGFLAEIGGYKAPFVLLLILPIIGIFFTHLLLIESQPIKKEFQLSKRDG